MAENIRVGIIGGNVNGWAGRAHMPAMAAGIPGVELVAVSTTRQESADEAAAKFGAKYAYDNHHDLLANPEVDVAAVAVKLPTHYELTKDIIAAGKHVYTEWPLGTTTAQAEEMTGLAAAVGVRTCVGLQSRHSAQYREIRRLIESGAIGDVLSVSLLQFTSGSLARPSGRIWMRDADAHANTHSITFGHAMDGLIAMLGPARRIASSLSTQVGEWTASDTGDEVLRHLTGQRPRERCAGERRGVLRAHRVRRGGRHWPQPPDTRLARHDYARFLQFDAHQPRRTARGFGR